MGFLGIFAKGLSFATKIIQFAPNVMTIVEIIASITGIKGADKLNAARQAIKLSIMTSEQFSGKEIIDEDLLDKGIEEVVEGLLKCTKAVKQD